jgi:hypothetical protein
MILMAYWFESYFFLLECNCFVLFRNCVLESLHKLYVASLSLCVTLHGIFFCSSLIRLRNAQTSYSQPSVNCQKFVFVLCK